MMGGNFANAEYVYDAFNDRYWARFPDGTRVEISRSQWLALSLPVGRGNSANRASSANALAGAAGTAGTAIGDVWNNTIAGTGYLDQGAYTYPYTYQRAAITFPTSQVADFAWVQAGTVAIPVPSRVQATPAKTAASAPELAEEAEFDGMFEVISGCTWIKGAADAKTDG